MTCIEELKEIKIKMAAIKLQALENELNRSNVEYLRTIKELKQTLGEKHQKQDKLAQ
jgi:hypothetical protein